MRDADELRALTALLKNNGAGRDLGGHAQRSDMATPRGDYAIPADYYEAPMVTARHAADGEIVVDLGVLPGVPENTLWPRALLEADIWPHPSRMVLE